MLLLSITGYLDDRARSSFESLVLFREITRYVGIQ